MSDDDKIRKSLATIKTGEKGWRKALASAEGSFSRKLAQENLLRLDALRQTLLSQLRLAELRKGTLMEIALKD